MQKFVDNKLIIIFEFLKEMYKHKSIASNSFHYLESFDHKDNRINQEREEKRYNRTYDDENSDEDSSG